MKNPKADNFYMPGEYEPHEKTLMLFPFRGDVWRLKAKPARAVFQQLVKAISEFEPVLIGVRKSDSEVAKELLNFKNVSFIEMNYDDCWMRDVGPTFVVDNKGEIRGVDWKFNAWGGSYDGLYEPYDADDNVAATILEKEGIERYRLDDFVLEGGSIHVDGEGTALVTEACLLSKGRNPHLTKEEIENKLKDYLNVEKVIWLPRGIYLDETNEHVDNVACFIKPGEVLMAYCTDPQDPQYELTKVTYDALLNQKDAKGRQIKIHKMVMPSPIYISDEEAEGLEIKKDSLNRIKGMRLAASYVNFYIINGAIVMPGFNDPNDQLAKETLEKLFPERKIIQINTREILLGGGNIHCLTQQMPRRKSR